MKSRFLLLYLLLQVLTSSIAFSQNIAINTTGNLPDTSAMLDIVSTTKGFLMPRMTTAQMNAIILPSKGLLIFNTTDNEFKVNTGTTGTPNWVPLISSTTAAWAVTGNSGTNSGNNFIGTTDNKSFRLRTNNTERLVVDSNGRVGIGTNAPAADLHIFQSSGSGGSKGIRLSGNSIGGTSSGTGFALSLGYNTTGNKQLWLGDVDYLGNSAGNFIRYNTNGTALPTLDGINGDNSTRKYVALGVAGDANSGVIFGNDGSATNPGSMVWSNGNMAIGNSYRASAAPANGLLVQGNMGIGTTAPGSALDVKGTLRLSGSTSGYVGFAPAAAAGSTTYTLPSTDGTSGQTLSTNGSGTLSWASSSGTAWSKTGNAGTTAGTNFIGTTDSIDFVTKTNGTERMRVTGRGNIGIGTSTFDATNPEKVVIDAGTTTSVNAMYIKGIINNYMQLNISNRSSGTQASSDIVATANNGTETTNFIDMGINGGSYSYQSGNPIVTGKANDGYLLSSGNDMYVVNNNATKSMLFLTGGTDAANERMRIQADGRIGIGVTNPTSQFVVKDTMEIRRTSSLSQLLFTNTAGTGDFRIGGDGGDLYWQGGGGRSLQMGSYWTTILGGDRQTATYPAYVSSVGGTGVLVLSQRSASIPLAIQAATSQTGNLTEWRNAAGTALNAVNASGQFGIGTTAPGSALDVKGTLRLSGSTSGYVGFAPAAAAGSTTYTLPAADGTAGQYLSTNGSGTLSWAATSDNDWSKTGNAGTTAGTNYIGTSDGVDFITKTNGTERIRVTSAGNVGINNTAPDEALTIGYSTASPFAIKLSNSSGTLRMGVANAITEYGMIAAGDVMIQNRGNKALAFGTNGDNIRMYISNGGNIGIGNTAPNSTLSVNGSLTVGYRTSSTNATLTASDYAVIHTGGSGYTWTIPAASTCAGRVYRLINHGTATITLSPGYKPDNASSLVTSLVSSSGTNMVEIISDGTNWRRIQ